MNNKKLKNINPRQFVENMAMDNMNPIIKELIIKAKNGDTKSVEDFARNFYREKGIDFDKEFSQFMSIFK